MIGRLEPLRDASALGGDAAALRRRAAEDGYLFVRGLVDRDAVNNVRARVQATCEATGWTTRNPAEGAAIRAVVGARLQGSGYDDPRWIALQCQILADPCFLALGDEPRLLAMLEEIYGERPRTRRGDICRVVLPGAQELTTPPHQDHYYMGGTPDVWTCWIPLTDVPLELGPLAVVPGSHRSGLRRHRGDGAGRAGVELPAETRWASAPLDAGDAILFHSLTLHGALPNTTVDRVRLSVDFRYQPASAPIAPPTSHTSRASSTAEAPQSGGRFSGSRRPSRR